MVVFFSLQKVAYPLGVKEVTIQIQIQPVGRYLIEMIDEDDKEHITVTVPRQEGTGAWTIN